MKALVIEDEPLASETLCDFVHRYDPGVAILGVVASVKEAVRWFREHPAPDVVFSDIALLDGNAFRIFEQVEVACPIIFTTAYDQFLLTAFDRNGIGYLLKPIEYDQLVAAMRKFELLRSSLTRMNSDLLNQLEATLTHPKYKERFVIKARGGLYLLDTRHVAYVQIEDDVSFAYDGKGARFPLGETLSELEAVLDPAIFFRLNRSEIVNVHFIERLEPYFQDRLAIKLRHLGVTLIASVSRTPALRKWLEGGRVR